MLPRLLLSPLARLRGVRGVGQGSPRRPRQRRERPPPGAGVRPARPSACVLLVVPGHGARRGRAARLLPARARRRSSARRARSSLRTDSSFRSTSCRSHGSRSRASGTAGLSAVSSHARCRPHLRWEKSGRVGVGFSTCVGTSGGRQPLVLRTSPRRDRRRCERNARVRLLRDRSLASSPTATSAVVRGKPLSSGRSTRAWLRHPAETCRALAP